MESMMTRLSNKERILLYAKIAKRSETLGVGHGDRWSRFLDIENADHQFNLRLEDFLKADDHNFAHDFIGIQANLNRLTGKIENCFVPRFAGNE